jgi:hypothetical protein
MHIHTLIHIYKYRISESEYPGLKKGVKVVDNTPIKRYETKGLIPWVLWLSYDDQQRNNEWECRNEQFVMDK